MGSSPLTRGKPADAIRRPQVPGLIPAHAGKTNCSELRRWRNWAHPRSRGENFVSFALCRVQVGSSPLTRGKPFARVAPPAPPGLIPAHAGKTRGRRGHSCCGWAHPRSRGENRAARRVAFADVGSSPLTRGKPLPRGLNVRPDGLIPAHAGKTCRHDLNSHVPRAHPRSRGENIQTTVQTVAGWGSSPLTRGKLYLRDREPGHRGLIPAHAGKTYDSHTLTVPSWAHPRSRGENHLVRLDRDRHVGSSPLTRGKRPRLCTY